MDDFEILVTGDGQAEEALARLATFALDLRWLWPAVSTLALRWIKDQFETEGAFGGDPWAPLSPEYLAWKIRLHPGKGILSAQGDLRRAATTPTRIATTGTLILRVEPYERTDRRTQRTETIEPSWFQEGTTRMPPRPILFGDPLPDRADVELDELLQREAHDLLLRLGLAPGRRA